MKKKNVIINTSMDGFIKLHISEGRKKDKYASVDRSINLLPGQTFGDKTYDQLHKMGKTGQNDVTLTAEGKVVPTKPKKKAAKAKRG